MSAGTRARRQGALGQDQPMQVQKGGGIETLPIEGSLQIKYDYVHLNVSYDIFDFGKAQTKNNKY